MPRKARGQTPHPWYAACITVIYLRVTRPPHWVWGSFSVFQKNTYWV